MNTKQTMPLTTSLAEIYAHKPCADGWKKLREHLGVPAKDAKTDTTQFPIATVLESNGPDDTLWVLERCSDPRLSRLFAADCAERVLHIFERERPDDKRPREAIAIARNPNTTAQERNAAARSAWDAGVAAAVAGRAAGAAAAARAPEWAADAAAWAAVWAAARAADSARAAGAARSAAGRAQKSRLLQYLDHGEAAKDMPWPEVGQ